MTDNWNCNASYHFFYFTEMAHSGRLLTKTREKNTHVLTHSHTHTHTHTLGCCLFDLALLQ